MTMPPWLALPLALAALVGCSSGDEAAPEPAAPEPAQAPRSAPPEPSETPAPEPAPPEPGADVLVGAQEGIATPFIAFGDRPARPVQLELSSDATATDVRWSGWGDATARGVGVVRINTCRPSCAGGRIQRREGLAVELADLRRGTCAGRPARFYTRATVRLPGGLGLPGRQIVVLFPRCVEGV